MKKTTIFRLFGFKPLFLLVFLITTLTLTAQTYLPMAVDSSYWVLSDNDNCSNISFQTDENITQYYLYGDTVISSVAYKKVYRRTGYKNACFDTVISYSPFVLYAVLRDDTLNKKVYTILFQNLNGTPCPTNQEFMLYDFDLQVGDSIKTNDWCILSVDEEIISTNYTTTFSIPNVKNFELGNNLNGLYLYEGIGSFLGLYEMIWISVSGVQQVLVDYCRGSCDLITTIDEKNKLQEQVSVYPNPSINYFVIENTMEIPLEYVVYSIDGKQIQTGIINSSTKKIYVPTQKGIYYLKLMDIKTKQSEFYKLLKM
ncbi:MAG: T9SS type A sorting domain-containing protein [Vicingaceae bacterium]|nr:T9SS type A sorting domain-containing protein [Vicingaceae bacterium]